MTQSAVSHQIKTLETYLDQPLFIRDKRKVVLSDAGAALLETTEQCLELLASGLQRLEHFKKPNQLILHASSAFAANWLVTRLNRFHEQNNNIDVWLYTTDMEPDLDLTEVHLAILHGDGEWSDLTASPVLTDVLLPLCSPTHPIMKKTRREPIDLLEHRLLHGEEAENWQSWFTRVGLTEANPTSGSNFSNPALMLQAAEQGQGIALASLVLGADALENGRLVSPLKLGIRSRRNYYLVSRENGLKSQNLAPFIDWLRAEISEFDAGLYAQLQANYELK